MNIEIDYFLYSVIKNTKTNGEGNIIYPSPFFMYKMFFCFHYR